MAKKKWIKRFLPFWVHRHLREREKFAKLRARDGNHCWFCGSKMRFGPPYNKGKAATIEHIKPLSKGGNGALENLALCHVGCNRHLADRSGEEKRRMREAMVRRTHAR